MKKNPISGEVREIFLWWESVPIHVNRYDILRLYIEALQGAVWLDFVVFLGQKKSDLAPFFLPDPTQTRPVCPGS